MTNDRDSISDKKADPAAAPIGLVASNPNDQDAAELNAVGYAQELERSFSLPAMGCLCLCLMATWEALSTVVSAGLVSGGAPCLFYNYLLSFICTVAVTCSLAEIASMYPTAGGQYYWVAALSPPSGRRFASYFTGWVSLGAQIIFSASAAFAAGLQTQSLIILNDESYIPTRWQGMLFYWAVLACSLSLNIWGPRLLPHINIVAGVIHAAGFFAIVVVLLVMAQKNTATFVFTEFSNNSGWTSDGVSWLVGLISSVYPLLGYDAACHLSEEIPHAARNVPIAMVGSVVVNGLIGVAYCIVLLFSIGSLEDILATPTGFPFMQIYPDARKSRPGATVMSLLLIIIAATANVACVTSASRTAWAFARDKALPFDKVFCKVSKKHQVPSNCIILVTVIQSGGIGIRFVQANFDNFVSIFTYGLDLYSWAKENDSGLSHDEITVELGAAHLPRLNHLSTQDLEPIRQDVNHLILHQKPSGGKFDWQGITDMTVARYSNVLSELAFPAEEETHASLQGRIERLLSPFVDYSTRYHRLELERCASIYLPRTAPTEALVYQAIHGVTAYICEALYDALADGEKELITERMRHLVWYLDWAIWVDA